MAIDATGPPTSLGIPTYNTSVDNPSGNGLNAIVEEIDDLLTTAPLSGSITGIAVGTVPVWNGTTWVKPGGTPTGFRYLRDDGQWGGDYLTYTPAWTASGTAPAVGNGTIAGRYLQIGKLVHVKIRLTAGSTSTFGTGDWRFSLPVTAATEDAGGTTTYFDSSASAVYHGLARYNGSLLRGYTNASPAVLVDATNPFTWATSDFIELDLVYEAA